MSNDTMLHAFKNAVRVEDFDEGFTVLIGPDRAGNLYEIGVLLSEEAIVVVHAMPARKRFLR